MLILRLPIGKFARAVREPAVLAFATTSSESAMPKAMQAMERLGVPKRIVGFVMPTGYSFNLDGSMIFLAVTSIFIVQAAGPSVGQHFGFAQQDRKSTRLNSSHVSISYAVFCLKKKKQHKN